jgi:hypothetical protein
VGGRGARGGSGRGLGGAGRSGEGTTAATKGGRGRALFLQRANSAQARARSSAHERETAPQDPLHKPLPNPPGNPHHADLPPSVDTPPTSSSPLPLLLGLDSPGGTGGEGGGGRAEISVGRGLRPSAEGRRSAGEGGGGLPGAGLGPTIRAGLGPTIRPLAASPQQPPTARNCCTSPAPPPRAAPTYSPCPLPPPPRDTSPEAKTPQVPILKK